MSGLLLARRYAASGLQRDGRPAVPASDFARDAALLALSARAPALTRAQYEAQIERGELLLTYAVRGAIHALDPADHATFGRALVGRDDVEVRAQTSATRDELDEVTAAVRDALAAGPLDKHALHAALRERVRPELLPYCRSCDSHHVAPGLWRYAAVEAGVRLDPRRRHVLAEPGPAGDPAMRFQELYPDADVADFAAWAGVTGRHARRLWTAIPSAGAPPEPEGVRLLPPGDPFLQKPNRELLAPDPALRRQLFRPVASPGVILLDGAVAGTWRRRGGRIEVEPTRKLPGAGLQAELDRIRRLLARGSG